MSLANMAECVRVLAINNSSSPHRKSSLDYVCVDGRGAIDFLRFHVFLCDGNFMLKAIVFQFSSCNRIVGMSIAKFVS